MTDLEYDVSLGVPFHHYLNINLLPARPVAEFIDLVREVKPDLTPVLDL
jgi:hypothetical protein